jgi:protein O-GlcNAc transferase
MGVGCMLQVSYLGYCGTMGAPYMQYMLSDNIVTPPEHRPYYQEKIITLPHSYFVNDHRQSAREAAERINMPDRARYGLPEGVFVFCCFNQLYKVDPAIFNVWMRLLKRVPHSVLWLLRFPPSGEENILKEVRVCVYVSVSSRGYSVKIHTDGTDAPHCTDLLCTVLI